MVRLFGISFQHLFFKKFNAFFLDVFQVFSLHLLSMLLGLLLDAIYILFYFMFHCVFICFCSSFLVFYFYVMLDVQVKTNIVTLCFSFKFLFCKCWCAFASISYIFVTLHYCCITSFVHFKNVVSWHFLTIFTFFKHFFLVLLVDTSSQHFFK
jgi:hypothetical protein